MAGEWITALSELPAMQFHEDVGPKLYVGLCKTHSHLPDTVLEDVEHQSYKQCYADITNHQPSQFT